MQVKAPREAIHLKPSVKGTAAAPSESQLRAPEPQSMCAVGNERWVVLLTLTRSKEQLAIRVVKSSTCGAAGHHPGLGHRCPRARSRD